VRTQNKYLTFCFKAFAAERLPDSLKAKGFNQRIIELICRDGAPKYDISEVVTTAGDEGFQYLLDELNATHNLLLAYRLLHFHDMIPNIKLNISNREKQLFKPIIRVFQNTRALKELLPVISEFVSRRRSKNTNTLDARLYEIVTELTNKNGLELESSLIWNTIKDTLQGEPIANKPMSCETLEFGTLSQKRITETLEQQFGARRSKHKGSGNKLIFNQDLLRRLERKYSIQVDVQVTTIDKESKNKSGEDGEVWGGSSLYTYISQNPGDTGIKERKHENCKDLHNSCKYDQEFTSQDDSDILVNTLNVPKYPQYLQILLGLEK
jgi:hypothetical protein